MLMQPFIRKIHLKNGINESKRTAIGQKVP